MVLARAVLASGRNDVVLCHLDHGLRGRAAAADARLVARFAKRQGCGLELAKADVKAFAAARSLSLEHAGRELRHTFFAECTRRHACRRLLLAHHADDQVETCFLNFLRGTGSAGLAGMRERTRIGRLVVLRPLLECTRASITAYAVAHGVPFRDDASNAVPGATRNKLRLAVLPAVEAAVGSSFRATVCRAARIARLESDWLESQIPVAPQELTLRELKAMPEAIRHRYVRNWLRDHGIEEPGWNETCRVLELLDVHEGPAKVNLPGGWHARRRTGRLFLEGPTR